MHLTGLGAVTAQPRQRGLSAALWQRPVGAPGMAAEHDDVRTQPLTTTSFPMQRWTL
jgi:hypothetical protein